MAVGPPMVPARVAVGVVCAQITQLLMPPLFRAFWPSHSHRIQKIKEDAVSARASVGQIAGLLEPQIQSLQNVLTRHSLNEMLLVIDQQVLHPCVQLPVPLHTSFQSVMFRFVLGMQQQSARKHTPPDTY